MHISNYREQIDELRSHGRWIKVSRLSRKALVEANALLAYQQADSNLKEIKKFEKELLQIDKAEAEFYVKVNAKLTLRILLYVSFFVVPLLITHQLSPKWTFAILVVSGLIAACAILVDVTATTFAYEGHSSFDGEREELVKKINAVNV